ncbi:hypothetical protein GMO_08140 [Gluconobacter morbifer G707]|uniref:Uncharacterized protein n=1 Tax=Gluconobacter morbifer G707 TaxID=1088869 RepID=G6XH49_9PROT|nr:hypothetical protein GMO_08140 [Gluconobacter morbifer G707]
MPEFLSGALTAIVIDRSCRCPSLRQSLIRLRRIVTLLGQLPAKTLTVYGKHIFPLQQGCRHRF